MRKPRCLKGIESAVTLKIINYSKMCQVGKTLLAEEMHRRTRAIYDYRAKKLVYRENRRKAD